MTAQRRQRSAFDRSTWQAGFHRGTATVGRYLAAGDEMAVMEFIGDYARLHKFDPREFYRGMLDAAEQAWQEYVKAEVA